MQCVFACGGFQHFQHVAILFACLQDEQLDQLYHVVKGLNVKVAFLCVFVSVVFQTFVPESFLLVFNRRKSSAPNWTTRIQPCRSSIPPSTARIFDCRRTTIRFVTFCRRKLQRGTTVLAHATRRRSRHAEISIFSSWFRVLPRN